MALKLSQSAGFAKLHKRGNCYKENASGPKPCCVFLSQMKTMEMQELGWDSWFENIYNNDSNREKLLPARITAEYAGCYGAESIRGSLLLSLSGKLRHKSASSKEIPVVGDWVLVSKKLFADKLPIIRILPRKTLIARKAAGKANLMQPIAANADYVFIVQGLDANYNIKRLDRYLTAVKNTGVKPVIILNKADLCHECQSRKKETEAAAGGGPVLVLDSISHKGYDSLAPYIMAGKTIAFIGSSGVGKSTIINELGAEKQKTGPVKAKDGKGMHTTTTRRLLKLKNGALLVDTPGMKEFAAWDASDGFSENFADIENIALKCKFTNCKHITEPECAVKEAVRQGIISASRLENYIKLKEELKKRKKNW